jgi:hypothetical protein
MCTDDNTARLPSDASADLPVNQTDENATPDTVSDQAAHSVTDQNWSRRTFLKAAALGTAAAAMAGRSGSGGLHLGSSSASAARDLPQDLFNFPCTAEDIFLVDAVGSTTPLGVGQIINEPCVCTGTFTAEVQFVVFNKTSTDRYCIALHLSDLFDAEGNLAYAGRDVILEDDSGSSDAAPGWTVMTGTLPSFPCNAGLVCSAVPSVTRGKCSDHCSTVAFSTSPGDSGCALVNGAAPTPPSGQCRHQQICIQGFSVEVECADGDCGPGNVVDDCCTVPCGEDLHLKITATGGAAGCPGPLTIGVKHEDDAAFTTVTPDANGCVTIPDPKTGTYTVRATDTQCAGGANCFREDTIEVCVESVDTTLAVAGDDNCDGVLTFTAAAVGHTGCSFNWWIDDVLQSETSNTLIYDPCALGHLDGADHTVAAQAVCGDCEADIATATVNQCVTSTVTIP